MEEPENEVPLSPCFPKEAIVLLDDSASAAHVEHPFEAALETVAQARAWCFQQRGADLARAPNVRVLARPGAERDYVASLVRLLRSHHLLAVHALEDFACVALVHEAAGGAAGRAVVAAALPESAQGAAAAGEAPVDDAALEAAMRQGTAEALTALGLPPAEAEVLAHVRPERGAAWRRLQQGLQARLCAYAQDHGPLLHVAFLAVAPSHQGGSLARRLLDHLGRMADTEGQWAGVGGLQGPTPIVNCHHRIARRLLALTGGCRRRRAGARAGRHCYAEAANPEAAQLFSQAGGYVPVDSYALDEGVTVTCMARLPHTRVGDSQPAAEP
eukprot:scaffold21.g2216.t1